VVDRNRLWWAANRLWSVANRLRSAANQVAIPMRFVKGNYPHGAATAALQTEVGGSYAAALHVSYDEADVCRARWDVEVHVERGSGYAEAG
jgi:hypothetical protein